MSANFDWTENQTVPGVAINPGTGPVHNASHDEARKNIEAFVADLNGDSTIHIKDTGKEDDGRFTFVLRTDRGTSEIDMPGIPLDEVRFTGADDQDIWDYPRLYENGSSWVWCYALSVAKESLWPTEEESDGA